MSILNDILDWVKDKPVFWQVAVDRLIRNNELTDNDIKDLKEICKVDHRLSKFDFDEIDFKKLKKIGNNSIGNNDIILTKIFNINNVNALSKNSELKFAQKGLTIVYGDNGSGKSSYVSILKHVCNTRGIKQKINGNLYDPACIGNDKKADIEYTIDGVNFNTVNLINEEISDTVLKSVDVFDTFSANHYIEEQDEIAFIPQGLSIVEKLAIGIKKVEDELNSELSSLSLTRFDYSILDIPEDSKAKKFLDNLNSETTIDELKTVSIWDVTKSSRFEEINKKIDELKATDPQKTLKENESKIKRFEFLLNKFQNLEKNLAGEKVEDLQKILNNQVIAREALKESSEKAFSELPIVGVGNSSWKILWESARKFYNESTKTESFPKVDGESSCPLCFQYLREDAKNRFMAFEDFVKNDVQQTYDKASAEFNLALENLNKHDFSFEEQKPIISELNELIKDFSENLKHYLELLYKQKNHLVDLFNSKKTVETIRSIKIENSPKIKIQELIINLKKINEKLKTQSIGEELKTLNKELNQLKGEKKIFENKQKLEEEINRQKKMESFKQCIRECNTRTITILSNDLTNNYITQKLKENFKIELTKLGFKNIKIETETKGKKGKQYHYLRLDEQNSKGITLKDILSEGEHRCISLATFLSELSIAEHKSTIIFDDPVSSLDHKWRNKISKRIAEEALERQVIVFTHDITFLLMIEENSNNLNCNLDIKSLTRKEKEAGLIATNPPWDSLSVNKRIGKLKNEYENLKNIERTETEEVYKEKVKNLYGKLRETWERFIEEVFLNGVIQRFGRAIQTQRLSKVVDLTGDDYKIVDTNMSKCSSYFTGHDVAGALIEEIPGSVEFLEDLTVLEKYIKAIRKRREK